MSLYLLISRNWKRRFFLTIWLLVCGGSSVKGQSLTYATQVGYLRFYQRLGGFVPEGESVTVGQVEVREATGSMGYLPDLTDPEFADLSYEIMDGPSVTSGHATIVSGLLFSRHYSLSPVVKKAKFYLSDAKTGFLQSESTLNWLSPSGPASLGVQVLNNSWITDPLDIRVSTQLNRRYDWLAEAHDIVIVAGVPNNISEPLPPLVSCIYNGIVVGVSSGNCAHGPVLFQESDGVTAGRCKPDIVAPMPVSSSATPIIASVATVLLDDVTIRKAAGDTRFENAQKPIVIKSIIQTGANKLAGWAKGDPADPTDDETYPLDFRQGAGQVDIDHSEFILSLGKQSPGLVSWSGWTYEATIQPLDSRLYYFALNDTKGKRLSATLNWHRKIRSTGEPYTIDLATLAHLQFEIYSFDGTNFTLLQASRSPVDNLQHLYLPELDPAIYVLRVINVGDVPTDFALSWATLPKTEQGVTP